MQNYALFFSKPSIIWNMSQIHNANVSFDDLNQRSTSNFLPPKSILASQANEDGLIREKMAVQMVSSGFEEGFRWLLRFGEGIGDGFLETIFLRLWRNLDLFF